MLDITKKAILLGIGLASMAGDKVEELGRKIAEEEKLSKEEGRKLVEDLLKQSDEVAENLKDQVEKLVENTLEKLNSPSSKDLQKLEKRIKKLEELQKVE
ncbi:MAG: hypothetical protein J7L19_02240 [Dehalococcoidia bacterium]|nr:hypothetical protein [Dehalococcoidia bacterium]